MTVVATDYAMVYETDKNEDGSFDFQFDVAPWMGSAVGFYGINTPKKRWILTPFGAYIYAPYLRQIRGCPANKYVR
ncbi:MAG: hypothetical protein QXM22_02820 [Candidatus Bathyarchaeia archaeon]